MDFGIKIQTNTLLAKVVFDRPNTTKKGPLSMLPQAATGVKGLNVPGPLVLQKKSDTLLKTAKVGSQDKHLCYFS